MAVSHEQQTLTAVALLVMHTMVLVNIGLNYCVMMHFLLLHMMTEDFMFNVGDKIVYPMHGAGVIESIEEKEILGQKQNYYVVRMPVGDMRVMIPTNNIDDIGIRGVIDSHDVDKVFDILKDQNINVTSNWNKRYRENMVKIKSGNIFEVAEVVRTLMLREREKGLSTGERKMLNSAKQILISELVLASGRKQTEIESMLDI
jgi:CarD family transcriptional regulator